jgi:L-seryl-tRNA(Ser) seleniumtransferase
VDELRALPSVERLASELAGPHELAVVAARQAVDAAREEMRRGEPVDVRADAAARLARLTRPGLTRALNATGVIVHTNLGRAPLAAEAVDAVGAVAAGYSLLEADPEAGQRGSRQDHVRGLLRELTGAQDALVVNNCAAAVLLAAAALAGRGREVVVSRGQLVEIGGSFRMPEVIAQSGARLVEVGSTNRTRLADYRRALGEDTGAILRAHPSNFRMVGFTEEVEIEELCALGVPVIDDVGSGALAEGMPALAEEPAVRRSVAAGAALVCFSGDKLLGGPQAGMLVGTSDAVARVRSHPLARAMRIDKLSLAALEATLRLYREPRRARERIPVLRMLEASEAELRSRAQALAGALGDAGVDASVGNSTCAVGGGALPLLELEGPAVEVDAGPLGAGELARRLRVGDPALYARVRRGRLVLEVRTLSDGDAREAAGLVARALAGG